MPNSVPDVPEWKLVAFAWLPIERWSADHILAAGDNDGKQYCKICDNWILSVKGEKHVKAHVKQEKLRRETRRLEGLEKARIQREETRRERKLAKENYEAVGVEDDEVKPKKAAPAKPAKAEINSSVPKAGKADKKIVVELEKALRINGEGTLVSLSEGLGVDVAVIRKQIGHVPGVKAIGYAETGKRGRPPVIYGIK